MELSDAREVLRLNPLFSSLTDTEIDSIQAKFTPQIYQRGDLITQIGASLNTFCVVHSGLARVVDQQSEEGLADSMILRRGGSFGEESLISDGPSRQTVEAEETLISMRLSTTEFQTFLGEFPRLSKPLESRIRHSVEFRFLMRLKLLPHLTLSQAEKLITQIEILHLSSGEPLFWKASPAIAAFCCAPVESIFSLRMRVDGKPS